MSGLRHLEDRERQPEHQDSPCERIMRAYKLRFMEVELAKHRGSVAAIDAQEHQQWILKFRAACGHDPEMPHE